MAIRRDDNKYTRLSLQQYNGQARDGEIVIDLDTYNVYVGTADGTLVPISNGGGNLANAIIGNLTVTGTSNLGNVGNITILGGSAGQVLSTDGTGNLTWISAGSSSYGNANVANYLPTYTGNLDSVGNITSTGNITAYDITGTGTVNANALAVVNNSTFGGNITAVGNIIGGNISTTGTVTATGNVTGGNLLTSGNLTVTGNATAGSLDTTLITGSSLTLQSTGTNAGINLDPNGTGNVNVNNSVINNVNTPVQGTDAANKSYVDGIASGLQIKPYVNAITTSVLPAYDYNNGTAGVGATITAAGNGALVLEGQTVQAGWRVLIKDETGPNAPYNGIYVVTSPGAAELPFVLTRATDDDTPEEAYSAYTFDEISNTGWVCLNTDTNNPITFGVTPIEFTQFSSAGAYLAGAGLSLLGQLFNVNVDSTTININGSNQIAVKPGAQLVNPNIGNATGTSITMTGNVTAGNTIVSGTSTSNAVVANTSTVAGNSSVGGNLSVTGNTTTGNITVAGEVTSNAVIANTSTVSGNSTVGGNLAVTGNTVLANVTATTSTVSGNSSVGGNFEVTGNTTLANVAATNSTLTGNSSVGGNLSVTGETSLGSVGNVSILGGLSGQFLQTDGTGNLTWANAGGGNGTANTGNITFANTTLSTAATLSNITLSTYDTANSITSNWVFEPNGNLTLPSNTSSINYANGAPYGGGNASIMAIPAVYFTAPITGNNQTFSNINLGLYASNTDLTVFYNGVLLENDLYTLAGDVLTVNTIVQAGDSIDIIRQFANSVPAPTYLAIPAVYFVAPITGNNQSFTDATLSQYGTTADLTVFYNGSLLEQQYYSLSGTTLTVNTPLFAGDTIDIPRQLAGNVGTFTSSYNDANVLAYLSSGTFAGNIIPAGNNIFSLGNATNQWKDLWVSNSTIYLNSVPLSVNAANVLTVGNANVVTTSPNGTTATSGVLTVTGNIVANTGYYFLGDGGLLSNINVGSDYSNANVANYLPTYLPTYTGNVGAGNIAATGRVTAATVSLGTGNLSLTGNTLSTTADTITIDPLNDGTNAGNVVVAGNLTVGGTLTYNNTVSATTEDLQWIAANNAGSPALATGAGLAVGPTGSYAQFVYNAGANSWQSSLPIIANGGVNANGAITGATTGTFSGNVTAPFFIGNGSQLTGMYGNAQVANYLPTYTGNVTAGNVVSSGNVIAARFIGDGSQLTSLPVQDGTYSNANVTAYLPTYLPTYLSTYTGNVTAGNVTTTGRTTTSNLTVIGNSALGSVANVSITGGIPGQVLTTNGVGSLTWTTPAGTYSNANVAAYMPTYLPTYTGNITAGNVATTGNVTATGNVQAAYFIGNGSQLTGGYTNANVADYLASDTITTPIIVNGNISTEANVQAAYFIGNGSQLTGLPASYTDANVATYLASGTVTTDIITTANVDGGNINVGAGGELAFGSGGNIYSIPTGGLDGTVTINGVNDRGISLTAGGPTPGSGYSQLQWVQDVSNYDPYDPAGSITNWVYVQNDGTRIENFDLLNSPGYSYSWLFGIDGNLTAAGNIITSNDVIANSFIGDGSQLTGLPAGYANADVETLLASGNIATDIITTANVNTANLTVSGQTSLGIPGNVSILGGNVGQVLGATGTGNLTWVDSPLYTVPPVYITAVFAGNNQTFSNTILASYTSNTQMTVFYNGSLLENTYYTLSGDEITVNIPLEIGDGIDVVTTIAGTVNSIVSSGYGNSNVAAYLPSYTGALANLAGDVTTAANVTAAKVSLGSGNLQLTGNVISTSGDTITIDPLGGGTPAGNVVVNGNLQVTGNLTYNDVVNATTNDLLWIAANNAINESAATGGGLAVGPLGAYASFTYNSGSNLWQSSLPILANGGVNANGALSGATTGDFSGNVTAPYFIGNGSQLTGLPANYGNSEVANYLASGSNVAITTSGNITATSFIGDGSQLTGLPAGYTDSNVATYLASGTDSSNIITTANISGAYILGNGSQLTGLPVANSIANGTSNVSIAAANGNINIAVNGVKTGTISATSIALGYEAGNTSQGANSVAIGPYAGFSSQGANSVAVGDGAGQTTQGTGAIAIGRAGTTNQQPSAIAIGAYAGLTSQGANAIAIGAFSGGINQAANSISIGANAQSSAAAIVLNASGANLLGDVAGFYVNPVRNDTTVANTAQVVTYNTTSRELTYANTLNLAGSITGSDFIAGNIANAAASKTRIAQFGANSYIQTGNGVAGTTGNIIFSPWADATAKVTINTTTGNITANNIGNVAAINLNGNASSFLNGAGTWSASTGGGGLRNITKVDQVYGYGTAFMIADGRLYIAKGVGGNQSWCSGLNPNDQSVPLQAGIEKMYELPFPEEDVGTIVDAGQYGPSAYALFANGDLYTWGYNGYGQLGIGSTTDTRIPILSNTNVAQVYVPKAQNSTYGIQRIVIRKTNNTYWGCGHDGQYQFGLGTNTNKTSWTALPWIPATALSVWMLGSDLGNIFIQKADGTITVTGYNAYGQLGINSTTQPTFPVDAPLWLGGDNTMRIQQICFGGSYQDGGGTYSYTNITMLLDNGTTSLLLGAGANNWGTLGSGPANDSRVPVTPLSSTGLTGRITKIASCGNAPRTMYALLSTGVLFSWGYNTYGQVGNGNNNNVLVPFQLSTGVLDIQGEIQGWDYLGYVTPSPFIKKADGYYACGYNGYGNLGDTTTTNKNVLTKLRVQKGVDFKFFATYGSNEGLTRLGITTDNKIWAWGYNDLGAVDPSERNWQAVQPLQFTPNALRT